MKDILINEELLEKIRKFKFIETLNSVETINIVPDVLTHHHLLMYRSIDEAIKQSYIAQNKSLLYKEEWQKLSKNSNYSIYGQAISPFPFVIEGAYHSRISLWTKINSLLHPFEKHTLEGNHNLNSLLDLKPYFKKYAEGFNEGFNDFEKDLITPLLLNLGSPDRESYANEVFKFITTDRSSSPTVTSGKGFLFTINSDIQFEIGNGYQDGVFEGYHYRAWSIIFSKNELFTPIFKKYLNGEIIANTKKPELKKEDLSKMQNHLISRVSLEYVYEFFSVLGKTPNSKGKFYLNEQKLLIFFKSTFEDNEPIPQSFLS
ncbi:hypothetical protein ESY86_04355 [Subsaximicrobium wynnwilliamsii]|uniref:Uncharacterized protein n=1 Tax=Subsaximicrobium wynnwilliamsii TaxID=291179 RepID=A0A5C6ZKR9_9FLAO|nr:hypothetical protein [Subsaximicrobium wynnwilliamsii]TXD84935.1 hypothetical protein ESY87_04135 [Subsaximicrobium wynnwilliamsii]TXD90606.1 hypothetical protein ESY86_04355 [Subsaximicrobium wynnwilliamsii]TXE05080.1 hypothetical protein ESY88_02660 [Subsaximicrobium wynnwilliamsii]